MTEGAKPMTMSAYAKPLGDRLPNTQERDAANQLRQILAAQSGDHAHDRSLKFVDDAGKAADIILTPSLSNVLMEVLRHIGSGDAVTLVPVSQMLTTQQAADILNVSRPFLIGLLEQAAIPYIRVGRHRRIKADDLFAYKQRRDETREAALMELAELDIEPA
jgi:excisionase family DNA binding protein